MSYESYHKRRVGQRVLKPETQMMGYGYDPALSEGALKPPVFLTSTFVFKSAQDGKDFFDYTAGRREPPAGQAAELLRGFTAGTQEVAVDVVVARDVDRERAYVEVQRVFTVRGTDARRAQTIYFGLRRAGSGYRLYEVRIVP